VLLGNVGSVGTVVGLPSGLITLPGNLQVGASIAANAASPFGGFSIALGADPRVFNFNQQGQLTGFDLLQAPVQGLAYDRFGNRLVLMGNVGSVGTVVGLPNIGPITLPGNLQVGASIAANPFGGFSVALGADPRVFNFNEQGQLTSFDLFTAPVQGLAFDRFGDRLVLLGNVGSVGTVVGLPSGLITLPGNLQVGASIAANPVPEPSSIALCGLGLMGVLVLGRRRRPRSEIRTRVFL
ncbi:MAG: PEP-CTERM sorting domain-containing protein, partial [Isosphaeraceae bacterium]|nr:PEP-CTERM sorting domain-containing protein [Isosphaeraceae bacterium]